MRCEATRADGGRCGAQARRGSAYCTFHDPALSEQRAEGRRRGGTTRNRPARHLPEDTPDFPAGTSDELKALLARVMNLTLRGQLDPKAANSVIYGASVQQRLIDGSDHERRLAALEQRLEDLGMRRRGRNTA